MCVCVCFQARVLEHYIDEVWQLLPEQFRLASSAIITQCSLSVHCMLYSVFDFLSLLKLGKKSSSDSPGVLVPSADHELTVSTCTQ